jgi:hypothetical protein
MSHLTSLQFRFAVFVVTLLVSLVGALPASAGCLREYGACGRCARQALIDAIWDLDPSGVGDAWVDGADCDIDLAHCILYDNHHSYECGA